MTLQLIEGWNLINHSSIVTERYDQTSGNFNFSSFARAGGRSLETEYQSANAPAWRWPGGVSGLFNDEYIVGMSVYWVGDARSYEGGDTEFIAFYRNAGRQCYMAWTTPTQEDRFTGKFVDGTGSSHFFSSDFERAKWHYVEVRVLANTGAATGYFEVRVNGQVVTSGNANTAESGSNGINRVHFSGLMGGSGGAAGGFMSDIYVLDTDGTKNNNFLGNSAIEPLTLIGDDNVNWGRSSGDSNYLLVDDDVTAAPDNDATYVFTSGSNAKDLYSLDTLTHLEQTIFGVSWAGHMRHTGSSRSVAPLFRQGANEGQGTVFSVDSTSYQSFEDLLEQNPTDGSDWLPGDFATLKMGMQVTT